jgi:hypothetical protein
MKPDIRIFIEKTWGRLLWTLLCMRLPYSAVKLVQAHITDVCPTPTDSMENVMRFPAGFPVAQPRLSNSRYITQRSSQI